MSLEDLVRTVPPPARPRHAAGDWSAVESRLRLTPPDDFKGIINRYGAGTFSDFLIVLNPFLPSAYLNFVRGSEEILHSARMVRESSREMHPKLFPEPEGLFPWAVTETGDTLFWRTGGPEADWPVVLRKSGGQEIITYPMSATAFLAEWLGRRSLENVFARDEYVNVPEFAPFRKTVLAAAYLAPVPEDFEARLDRLMKHMEARRIKNRYKGLQDFNQCSFRAGPQDVLVVYSDDADFGSRLELHVPRTAKDWAEDHMEAVPTVLGSPFRRLGGATTGFSWEGTFETDDEEDDVPAAL